MLTTLLIRNYALIDELQVAFANGLVIITGETGAGKSIIVDAVGLVLGERASVESIRTGADKAVVEGTFTGAGSRKLRALLEENSIEPGEEIIVRREISARGQSRCFVNDSPATLALLKQVGDMLMDLHGQHEHQSLLRPGTHGEMLDDFGGLGSMVEEFRRSHAHLQETERRLRDVRTREQHLREKRELYEFQIREIDALAPQAGEEEDLSRELMILENAEQLFGSTTQMYESLYGGDHSVHDLLVVCRNRLHDLAAIDPAFEDAAKDCTTAETLVGELAKFIQKYNAGVEFNPARLEQLRDRLGKLSSLKRKYGGALDQVIAHRRRIGEEVALAENFEEVLATMSAEVKARLSETTGLARRLTAKRREVARGLDRAIIAELKNLGIASSRFETHVEALADGAEQAGAPVFTPRGGDSVEFFISTNTGEDLRPLARVASGGEVSRIMLALKTILAKSDRLPVLVFDEIDVGVSGRIAQAVGLSLKNLSRFHQVVAITHLPQIAGLADEHFVVQKHEKSGRTSTTMLRLSDRDREHEVARLMSGAEVTEAGLRGARELMNIARGR
jgi:DNA repair protein RecN (Recombination protein N)